MRGRVRRSGEPQSPTIGNQGPAEMLLTQDVRLGGLALGMKRIKILVESLLGGLARIRPHRGRVGADWWRRLARFRTGCRSMDRKRPRLLKKSPSASPHCVRALCRHLRCADRFFGPCDYPVGCLLCHTGCRKDRPRIGLGHPQPRLDALGMIFSGFGVQPQVCKGGYGPQFGCSSSAASNTTWK
jgi:hypothetical protein